MNNTVKFRIGQTGTVDLQPSDAVWSRLPYADVMKGDLPGFARHWNFASFRTSTNVNAAEAYWADGLKLYGSDGAAVAALDVAGGGVTLSSDGDNEGAALGQMVYPFQLIQTAKAGAWEVCLRTSTIADTKHGFFWGLIDASALSATVPIAAAGTLADENFVGFHRLEGDGDQLDTVYKANTVTQVDVDTDVLDGTEYGEQTLPTTLAVDTDFKLGMRYWPSRDQAGDYTLAFYYNGIRLPATKQLPSAAGTDFPNDVRLGLVFALLNATASTPGNTSLRWMRGFQLF